MKKRCEKKRCEANHLQKDFDLDLTAGMYTLAQAGMVLSCDPLQFGS